MQDLLKDQDLKKQERLEKYKKHIELDLESANKFSTSVQIIHLFRQMRFQLDLDFHDVHKVLDENLEKHVVNNSSPRKHWLEAHNFLHNIAKKDFDEIVRIYK